MTQATLIPYLFGIPASLLAVFPSLISFLVIGIFGNALGKRISGIVSVAFLGLSAFSAWVIFADVLGGHLTIHTEHLMTWMHVGSFLVDWQLYLDPLTCTMMMVVTTVSFLVHLYSLGYMDHDGSLPRFMAYLGLFTFTMLMLVTASNLIQVFFGWEGVGLASYLLIGFWHHKDSANAASMKAFIVNRVGDVGLALGIAALYFTFESVDISVILSQLKQAHGLVFQAFGYTFDRIEVIGFLLFIGAMGKSAQLGLHTWLPDAMEGPTPVSALIHAATMVTAGVFLVARLSPLYELAPHAKSFIVVIGATTALFAGTIALMQNDIKRVIAYSTCSQLGYMFFAAGLGAYNIAIFHLVTHAFFKALLFLGSGAVIHAMSDEQDMRRMGGIWRGIPATYAMMWIGSLALAGIPFFAGFYSKDAILMAAWFGEGMAAKYAFMLGIGAAFLTALYSWRLLIMTFNGPTRADEKVLSHLHESGPTMLIPLFVLSIGAIFSGFIFEGFFTHQGFWQNAIAFAPSGHEQHAPFLIHHLPLLAGSIGIGLAYYFYFYRSSLPARLATRFQAIYKFLLNKWYVDELYHALFVVPAQKIGSVFWKTGDEKTIDGYGPNGVAARIMKASSRVSRVQSGYMYHYALVFMMGFAAVILWLWIY